MDIQAGQSALPLPSAEINLGGTSTSEKQFITASASGGVATGQPVMCRIPASNTLKNRSFLIRVAGRVTGGASGNFTCSVYFGNSTTIGSNTKIMSTGAVATGGVAGNYLLEAVCFWDATSKQIGGTQYGYVAQTNVAQAVLSGFPASVDLSVEPNLAATGAGTTNALTVTGTFGTGNASNVALVDVFEVIPM